MLLGLPAVADVHATSLPDTDMLRECREECTTSSSAHIETILRLQGIFMFLRFTSEGFAF
jgi:hypothetical protein